jgi:hypothetical protein
LRNRQQEQGSKWTGTHWNTIEDDTTAMNSSFMEGVSLPPWLLKFYNFSTRHCYYYTAMFAGLYTYIAANCPQENSGY